MFSSISLVTEAILVAGLICPVIGQTAGDEIRITEQYPPAELRFQDQRFVAVHRKPVPQPGADDQWVVVRDRNWVEKFRAYPGQDLARSARFNLFELEQRLSAEPPRPTEEGGERTTGFMVTNAALSDGGLLAISGYAWLQTGRSVPVIALYRMTDGKLSRVASTFPVQCWSLEFGAGDDLWCIGSDVGALRRRESSYDVLYRYSREGKLILHGVPRDSLSGGKAPESNAVRGVGRIFITDTGKPLLVIPAADTIVLAGRDGVEIRRWQPARFGKTVTYTLAAGGTKRLLALLPDQHDDGVRARYKLQELVADKGAGERGAFLADADTPAAVRWVVTSGAGGRDFAGRSTELVGLDGKQPVIWDRSAGRVEWLEPID